MSSSLEPPSRPKHGDEEAWTEAKQAARTSFYVSVQDRRQPGEWTPKP